MYEHIYLYICIPKYKEHIDKTSMDRKNLNANTNQNENENKKLQSEILIASCFVEVTSQ